MNRILVVLLLAASIGFFFSCEPQKDADIDLGIPPEAPQFSLEILTDSTNRVVVTDLSQGNFDRLWDFPGGTPKVSKLQSDTVQFAKAGEYTITLHITATGGSGTNFSSQNVVMTEDATLDCDPKVSLLTGECGPGGKCWTFSLAAGAVSVGPDYGSGEWFTSGDGGLAPEQYDDNFCFFFENAIFQYNNNGQSINPWDGFIPVDYDPPVGDWQYLKGAGMDGRDRIVLSEGQFMGTWDSGNILDIESLTEDQLIIRTFIADQSGAQVSGWFEFVLEPR